MGTVHKSVLRVEANVQAVIMPVGSVVLTAQMQRDDLCIWYRMPGDTSYETRYFIIAGTGGWVENKWVYVGTVQQGQFIWHIFEVKA